MTVSYWRRAGGAGELRTDVAVVGGGIAGLGCALWLRRRGLGVVVLERDRVGSGASGRNAGFLMRGPAENYALAAEAWGRERARSLWRMNEENLALLRAEGATALPSYRPTPSCLVAFEAGEAEQLRRSVGMLREDGFDAAWVDSGDDSLWRRGRALGGLLNPGDGSCNPVELVEMLRGACGAEVLEGQEVVAIEGEGEGVALRTGGLVVHAGRVVVCTNAYVPLLLPGLGPVVTPRRGQMFAAVAPGVRLDCCYYANHGSEYFRQAPDGALVVGGCRTRFAAAEVGYEDRTTDEVQGALEAFAGDVLGVEFRVVARWAGTMGFSPDGLPLVGPVAGAWAPGRVWFCGGFTGHGMSMAFVTARDAVSAMVDGSAPAFPLSRVSEGVGADG